MSDRTLYAVTIYTATIRVGPYTFSATDVDPAELHRWVARMVAALIDRYASAGGPSLIAEWREATV